VALFSRFFGRTVSEGAAFAVGTAVGPALHPIVQDLANEAWTLHPTRPINAGTLAIAVAAGQIPRSWAVDEARRTGINADRFGRMVDAADNGPGVAYAFELWRRQVIGEAAFRRAVKRSGIEDEWIDDLVRVKTELLDPGQLAAAIHRGLIPDPGLLKGEQPSGPRNVESYPVYPVHALDEAAGSGYDRDRLGVLVGLQGLPMGPHEAAQALFRGIITHGDYIAAFNESNSRNEWAQAVLDQSRQIPTSRDFFENALRGYHTFEWALNEAKRHGMSEADATVIYQNQGRPMNIRQITQALSRGGKFKPEPGELTDPYDASIVEGNVKPAYYDLAKALRYTLPSPFVMRQLTASGVWSEEKAAQRLKDSGWMPQDADEAAHAWAQGTGGTADPHIAKAQVQLWTAAHRSYLRQDADDATATTALTAAGVSAEAVPQVLALWAIERDLSRLDLTPAQIAKAYKNTLYTLETAVSELVERGMTLEDASTFLGLSTGQIGPGP
jgi:hypothetical protein